MISLKLVAAASMLVLSAGMASPAKYQEGQVWEYATRAGDDGSLAKIQKIEQNDIVGLIYHISIIGVHFHRVSLSGTLGHLPVSQQTLDMSVTKLSNSKAAFPDATEGIAEWRKARGGVFTISLADVVSIAEKTVQSQPPQPTT